MKAVICTKYGPPNVLRLVELEKPVPRDNEVLVKIHATTVTPGDCRIRSFTIPPMFWLMGRIALGVTRPRHPVLGFELAGEIESVGKKVTKFKIGDRVFGSTYDLGFGAHAEYKCMPENGMVTTMPADMSYEEAAGVTYGGNSALWFLRQANVTEGQKVLINGASGGVGVFAVQLARHFGAEVTSVCGSSNVDLVRSLGADLVIDYTKEDFTNNGVVYDVIFDAVGKTSATACKDSLKETGVYLSAVLVETEAKWQSMRTGRKVVGGTAVENPEQLEFLKELFDKGEMKVVIDRQYSLDQIVEAHRYVDAGHKKGNVVISVTAEHAP